MSLSIGTVTQQQDWIIQSSCFQVYLLAVNVLMYLMFVEVQKKKLTQAVCETFFNQVSMKKMKMKMMIQLGGC
ncbi:hypothetical protein P8452_20867 [Trifolium repens]|nr:hypothetical protein P8452_20867 [Trifolium repens]